jgi:hypothetical protein
MGRSAVWQNRSPGRARGRNHPYTVYDQRRKGDKTHQFILNDMRQKTRQDAACLRRPASYIV